LKKWDLPKGWVYRQLGEVSKIRSGGTPSRSCPEYWSNGTIPWVKIGDMSSKYVNKTQEKISQSGLDNSAAKLLEKNTLLISIFATLGEVSILKIDAACNQAIAGITADPKLISTDYLYYYVKHIKNDIKDMGRGVAQNNINLSILNNTSVMVPPLETQQKIVAILDKAEEIKRLRAEANAQTQKLIQSVFLDMFGDLEVNPNRWGLNKISNFVILDKYVVKSTEMSEFTNYVGLVNIVSNTGELIKDNNESYENIKSDKFKFTKNHILYGKLRPYLNKVALPDYDGICSTDILTFRPLDGVATREYIGWLLRTPYFVNFATNKSQGANLPRISPSQIMNFECPQPPYDLQIKFSNFVRTVEMRNKIQNLVNNEIDSIYRNLNNEIFKGELVA